MATKTGAIRAGARPGELQEQASQVTIRWVRYNETQIECGVLEDFSNLPQVQDGFTLWLDIVGVPGRVGLLALHDNFGLHKLALEDVQNAGQNPKLDAFDDHIYLTVQMPLRDTSPIAFEQLNFFLVENLMITICQCPGLFDPIHGRLDAARGMIRKGGPEYLLYACIDLAVDLGVPVSNDFTEQLFELENRIDDGQTDLSREIYSVRRQLSALLRQARRQDEMIRELYELEHEQVTGEHRHYWRDCLDHAVRLSEGLSYQRETAADMLNTHLALISHRMNDVMKVLTIMSTIFIPLSFLVGLYGMNFNTESHWNMPELNWRFGYFYILSVMAAVVAGLMWFFRKKRWI